MTRDSAPKNSNSARFMSYKDSNPDLVDDRDLPPIRLKCCLSEQHKLILQKSKLDHLQRTLLSWLSKPDANGTQMLRWLAGARFQYNDEPTSEAILRALPDERPEWIALENCSDSNTSAEQGTLDSTRQLGDASKNILRGLPRIGDPFEPPAHRVLKDRMGEIVRWLTKNEREWHKLAGSTWYELFALLERLHAGEYFPELIQQLRVTCEGYVNPSRPVFQGDREAATVFTRLVAASQPSNELLPRWVKLIAGETDSVLRASSGTVAVRYLLSMPNEVDFESVECAIAKYCSRLNNDISNPDVRCERIVKLQQVVDREFSRYTDHLTLIFARLWNDIDWMPIPDPIIFMISTLRELAVLGHLVRITRQDESIPYYRLACLMHQSVQSNTRLSVKMDEYLRQNFDRPADSVMKAGNYDKNWRRFDHDGDRIPISGLDLETYFDANRDFETCRKGRELFLELTKKVDMTGDDSVIIAALKEILFTLPFVFQPHVSCFVERWQARKEGRKFPNSGLLL